MLVRHWRKCWETSVFFQYSWHHSGKKKKKNQISLQIEFAILMSILITNDQDVLYSFLYIPYTIIFMWQNIEDKNFSPFYFYRFSITYISICRNFNDTVIFYWREALYTFLINNTNPQWSNLSFCVCVYECY